jgi:hypothetical protein
MSLFGKTATAVPNRLGVTRNQRRNRTNGTRPTEEKRCFYAKKLCAVLMSRLSREAEP